MLHPLTWISYISRNSQKLFPQRPIRGMSRLSKILRERFPNYEAVVTMNPNFKMRLSSKQDAEMSLLMLGAYQPALSHLIKEQAVQGGYFLDVGANLGFFSLWFASLAGSSGKAASFEANPEMVARIRDAVRLNDFQLDVVEKAVHSKSGESLAFFVSKHPGKSSIYADNVKELQGEIIVETLSIDDYLESHNWPRLDLIKMDIEGNDCFALLGAEKSIRKYHPFIVFEYSELTDKDTQDRLATLFSTLDYRLEILRLNGSRQAFTWQVPAGVEHVDVLCFPPKG